MQIVDLFYRLAREHEAINAFIYDEGREKGSANEAHPLVWLDDPIHGQSDGANILRYTANVDILGVPVTKKDVLSIQSAAFRTGLEFKEKISGLRAETGISVDGFSFITLREYYDNSAAGVRFTYHLTQANPVNRCGDRFDPDKQFSSIEALPDFTVEHPDGYAVFDKNGLPNFTIPQYE